MGGRKQLREGASWHPKIRFRGKYFCCEQEHMSPIHLLILVMLNQGAELQRLNLHSSVNGMGTGGYFPELLVASSLPHFGLSQPGSPQITPEHDSVDIMSQRLFTVGKTQIRLPCFGVVNLALARQATLSACFRGQKMDYGSYIYWCTHSQRGVSSEESEIRERKMNFRVYSFALLETGTWMQVATKERRVLLVLPFLLSIF